MRDRRRNKFCFQEHNAVEAIHHRWSGRERTTALAIYQAMTYLASVRYKQGGRDGFTAGRAEIAEAAGSKPATVDTYARVFEGELGLITRTRKHDEHGRDLPSEWALETPERCDSSVTPLGVPVEAYREDSSGPEGEHPTSTRAQESRLLDGRPSEPSSSSTSATASPTEEDGSDGGSGGNGSDGVVSQRGEQQREDPGPSEPRVQQLRDQRKYLARVAYTVLTELAKIKKAIGRLRELPTLEGIEAVIERHPTRNVLSAIDKLEFWAEHGTGKRVFIESMEALFGKFLRDANHVVFYEGTTMADPPDALATDWGAWVEQHLPYAPGSEHFVVAVAQATMLAFRGHRPEPGRVAAYTESRKGAYRAEAA